MTDFQRFFSEQVLPQLPDDLTRHYATKYPAVSLVEQDTSTQLKYIPIYFLMAFTGTGKTTTLDELSKLREQGDIHYVENIPTRRELADWIIIPTAQTLQNQPVEPVKNRVQRFEYTRHFAEVFPGGSALVYSTLHYAWDGKTSLLSDGIRGASEMSYALTSCPAWHIIELWVDLLVRLERLSQRNDEFDRVSTDVNLRFLPDSCRSQVEAKLIDGEIRPEAIRIVQAEAQNYGLEPLTPENSIENYTQIDTTHLPPSDVARQIALLLK